MTLSFISKSLVRFVSGGVLTMPRRSFTLVMGLRLITIYHRYPFTYISSLVCVFFIHRSAVNCPRTLLRGTTSSMHLLFSLSFFSSIWSLFQCHDASVLGFWSRRIKVA